MRKLLRSTFTLRLLGGFVIGTAGMIAVHAASASDVSPYSSTPVAHVAR